MPAKPQRQVRIGGIDGVQLVGNEDDDLVRQTGAQVVKQGISGFAVEMGGGFVDEKNAGIGQQGAGDRDPLPLTAREMRSTRADAGVQTLGKVGEERTESDQFQCADHLGFRRGVVPRSRQEQVGTQGRVEKVRFLWAPGNKRSNVGIGQLNDVTSIQ